MFACQRCSWRVAARSTIVRLALATLATGCSPPAVGPRTLDIATTTSVVNSGLLSTVLPLFEKEAGITVRAHAAGSGRALEMLHDRVIDLVISHAPQAEARMLAQHPDWQYQKIATNQFLIVGPRSDPAAVRSAADAADAFRRIAASGASFVSRGDGSGTHERETELWTAAKATMQSSRLLISGSGMGATLRQADEREAYTLTDDATFSQLRDRLTLEVQSARDPRLLNSYAVVFSSDSAAAGRFAEWLTSGHGRTALADHQTGPSRPFRVWPRGCPGDSPARPLCNE